MHPLDDLLQKLEKKCVRSRKRRRRRRQFSSLIGRRPTIKTV